MKLSAKTRYAARILLYLAKYGIERPISSSKLATQTGISSQFIEQILRQLPLRALRAVFEARGGHVLLRKPEDLTFGCIVKLMEGGIELSGCLEKPGNCVRFDGCEVRRAWENLQATLDGVFESITLRDLMQDDRILSSAPPSGGPLS